MTKPAIIGPRYTLKSSFPHAPYILRSILGEYLQNRFGTPGTIRAMETCIARMDKWKPGEELVTWLLEANDITARRLLWHAGDMEVREHAEPEQIMELRTAGANFRKWLREHPAPIAAPVNPDDVDMDKNLYDDDLPCTCPSLNCARETLRARQQAVRAAEQVQAVVALKDGADETPTWQKAMNARHAEKAAAREAAAAAKPDVPEIVFLDVPNVGRMEVYTLGTVAQDIADLIRFIAQWREQVDPASLPARVLLDDIAYIVNTLRLTGAVRDAPGVPRFPKYSTRDESGVSMVFIGR